MLGAVWPEHGSSAAGVRDRDFADMFLTDAGWEVTFASSSKITDYTYQIEAMGARVWPILLNDSSFDEGVKNLNPDVVWFDRFVTEEQFGWRVRESCPDALTILDTQDLHFVRRARHEIIRNGGGLADVMETTSARYDWSGEIVWREVASILRCDGTLVLSDFEYDLLCKNFSISPELLYLSRFFYRPQNFATDFEEKKHFVMIGNFRHPPNLDALFWMHGEIWPQIRRALPGVELHVYGAYPPREAMKLDDAKSGVRVMGWTPDQYATLEKYRVSLAPLRFGAGIKGKITDSWQTRTAVVTTPVGAEGMCGGTEFGGCIALTPDSFAEAAVAVYQQKALWLEHTQKGSALLRLLYDRKTNAREFLSQLDQWLENREKNRRQFWMGGLLRHHHLNGVRYFSKWIEEKNRNHQ